MPQDALKIKERILSFLRIRGPSLPVHIAKDVGMNILFTSAFLSELYSESKIRISHTKVGNSPVYFIPGHEYQLENFSKYLNTKEKEAFSLLKEKKFLDDKSLEPAIRVALRAIKDFAIPFKVSNEIFWRYFSVPEQEFKLPAEEKKQEISIQIVKETEKPELEIIKEEVSKLDLPKIAQKDGKQKELGIFDRKPIKKTRPGEVEVKKKEIKPEKIKKLKKISKKISHDDKFFNKVKDFLSSKGIEVSGIEGFSKSDLILKIKDNGSEKLLIAYNKKRITESDIVKAHKKSKDYNLDYTILSVGDMPKKLKEFIESAKGFSEFEKF